MHVVIDINNKLRSISHCDRSVGHERPAQLARTERTTGFDLEIGNRPGSADPRAVLDYPLVVAPGVDQQSSALDEMFVPGG